ncbi:hypothetical protein H6G91_12510 [Nostoc muscorum FACHB-395]|nr:hypothetical protein [Desmonostoc muscorum FACHB-395]
MIHETLVRLQAKMSVIILLSDEIMSILISVTFWRDRSRNQKRAIEDFNQALVIILCT